MKTSALSTLRALGALVLLFALAPLARGAAPTAGADTFVPRPTQTNTLLQALGNGADGEIIAINPEDGFIYHSSGNGTVVFEKVDPVSFMVTNIPTSGTLGGETFGMVWYPPIGKFLRTNISAALGTMTTDGTFVALPGSLPDGTRGLALVGTRVFGTSPFQAKLFELNPAGGPALSDRALTLTGGTMTGTTALTTDPLTGSIYAMLKVTGVATRVLGLVDVRTSTATMIGETGHKFSSLTFDASGKLLGVTGNGDTVPETLFTFQRAPVVATEESGALVFTGLLGNDTDPDVGDTLDTVPTGQLVSPLGVTYQIQAGGSFTYNPSTAPTLQALGQDELAPDTFSYTVTDQTSATATGSITVTVAGVNDAPALDLDGPGGTLDFRATRPLAVAGPVPAADSDATLTDVDANDRIFVLTASLSGVLDAGSETLAATVSGAADTVVFANNVLTVTASGGTAPAADFQAVLRTLTYTNSAGSPTRGARTVAVAATDGLLPNAPATSTIAVTTPPILTLPNSPVVAGSPNGMGVVVNFNVSATDAEDGPLTPVATPASGSVFPLGNTTVNVTVTDSDGATVTGSFQVRVGILNPITTVILAKGDPTPGAGSVGGPPADALMASFGVPAVDESGNVAFVGKWSSESDGKGSGLFFDGQCLAVVGGNAPGIAGASYQSFGDPVVARGRIICIAKLAGVPAKSSSVVLSDVSAPGAGTLQVIARTGDEAPDATGATPTGAAVFKTFKGVALGNKMAVIYAQLSGGTGLEQATAAKDLGVWAKAGGDPLTLCVREGQNVGLKTIKTVTSFVAGAGSPGQGRGWIYGLPVGMGTEDAAQVLATFTDKSQAVLSTFPAPGGPLFLARTVVTGAGGPSLMNATFASFGVPATNDVGNSAFLATLTVGDGAVTAANARGIFANPAGAVSFASVARVGDAAAAGGTGAKFTAFQDPVFSVDGGLAFPATIKSATVKGLASKTIWWQPFGEALELVAQGGDEPPGVSGAQWSSFTSLAIAGDRGPIIAAKLVPGKGGVKGSTANGVWATDFAGALRLLFRSGDTIGGKKLKKFKLLGATVGSTGVTRSFNGAQQVVWQASFTDKSTAIVNTQVP